MKNFSTVYPQLIQQFLDREQLPPAYGDDVEQWFLPFIESLKTKIADQTKKPFLVGVNGAQGTGKTTFCRLLEALLQQQGIQVITLSIDDYYLGKADRSLLGKQVHPLLATRGVPGTHDIARLTETLSTLASPKPGETVLLPRFNKAEDDLLPREQWRKVSSEVDLVLLEGWCVGVAPQEESALAEPINELESREDPDGVWRRYVNSALAQEYRIAFDQLQHLVLLQAPSFEQVYAWRGLQEQKLREARAGDGAGIMSTEQLEHFIQHYERLTRHALETLPSQADTVFPLDRDHRITGLMEK